MRLDHATKWNVFLTTHVTRMTEVRFLVSLSTCQPNFIGIYDNDVVSRIKMGSKNWLVLATKYSCNSSGQASERLFSSVDDPPVSRYVLGFRRVSFNAGELRFFG